jgi:cyclic beta-1,2-glucan synthetase
VTRAQLEPELQKLAQLGAGSLSMRGKTRLAAARVGKLKRDLALVYRSLETGLGEVYLATRAEEWLLDNRHVIEDALETLEDNLPNSYLRRLPGIPAAQGRGHVLHVEALARQLLESGRLPVDLEWVGQQVDQYQDIHNLTIGELWALPGLMTLLLVEDLVSAAGTVVEARNHQASSEEFEERRFETSRIAGLIISLRNIEGLDWHRFFERVSRVEAQLHKDPENAYHGMEFESRNRYRSVIEALARGCRLSEPEVAEAAVDLASSNPSEDPRVRHVGYYLISGGRRVLEKRIAFRAPLSQAFNRLANRQPGLIYFSTLAVLIAIPMGLLSAWILSHDMGMTRACMTLLLGLLPVISLSIALLNGLLTWLIEPRALARMDFENGLPEDCRTSVVMPVLFSDPADVEQAFSRLESNYLSNPDRSLVYAILGDFPDAAKPSLDSDGKLLDLASTLTTRLNEEHPEGNFLFLNRHRQWNPCEGCWMGWERKRGNLMEFNRLLSGSDNTSYQVIYGDRQTLDRVRYVITLDADTRMPPGTARRLVGTLAHPLSRAVFDSETGRLKAGYSIIQPRLEIDPDNTVVSPFTRIFSGDNTIDIYTHATSDVYFDLFGEGIFTGKGIYDWQALERTLHDRIPENSVLSHDLLEGAHGRVALATDLVLLEQFPANTVSFMRRLHRWVRGDWQLIPWLKPGTGNSNPARLRVIHRWKIVDNLRRSLIPPIMLVLLVLAWIDFLPGSSLIWTLIIAALMAAPLISEVLSLLTRTAARPSTAVLVLLNSPSGLMQQTAHWLVSLLLLPYQSWILLDAICRTLFRVLFSRRHLLEWTAAAHVHRRLGSRSGLSFLVREMWISPAVSVAVAALLVRVNPDGLAVAVSFLTAWLFAAFLCDWLNRAHQSPKSNFSSGELRFLRTTARRTWLFFDHFMSPDNHWLPPDNYQEDPRVALARRTSPTNIGMGLNATLAAHDFGWIDLQSLVARLENTMERMASLERHRGHWLNWYETEGLHPLHPRYVSTVDSGNLAASLITLARGLDRIAEEPFDSFHMVNGLTDTLAVMAETLLALPGSKRKDKALLPVLASIESLIERLKQSRSSSLLTDLSVLRKSELPALTDLIISLNESVDIEFSREALHQLRIWIDELDRQARHLTSHIEHFMPWTSLISGLEHNLDAGTQSSQSAWQSLLTKLNENWTVSGADEWAQHALRLIEQINAEVNAGALSKPIREVLDQLPERLATASLHARQMETELKRVSRWADDWVSEMDFSFLYDRTRHLFRIGFDVSSASPDPNHYDMLASEARLASLIAIAKGDVPLKHWLHLGRPYRRRRGRRILMSWGATMFEYLMPRLYTPTPPGSMLDRACQAAIGLHKEFAAQHGLPWGISESGYYQLDDSLHYQYRSFGVPLLGFRRDLGDRLVIAPYASVLAIPFQPQAVISNLERLRDARALGLYGFHEAIDYGRREKLTAHRPRVVRSWMSHHQGMTLLALDNFINADIMVNRFQSDPRMSGVSLLLHEAVPRMPPRLKVRQQPRIGPSIRVAPGPAIWSPAADSLCTQYTLLSNGHFSSLVDSSGGGASRWNDIALTRWRPDRTCPERGHQLLIKDMDSDQILKAGATSSADDRQTRFGPHQAEVQYRDQDCLVAISTAISSQHDIEARKLSLHNESDRPRRLMILSYAELAMAPVGEFERHPAFSRLFVESECLLDERMLLFRRRPRSSEEKPLYLAHTLVMSDETPSHFGWDTSRKSFLGRNCRLEQATGLNEGVDGLAGHAGAVLDPAIAAAVEITLPAFGKIEIAALTGVGRSRRELLANLRSFRSISRVSWLFEQAYMQTAQELHLLREEPAEARESMQLLSAMLSPEPGWRRLLGALPATPIQSLLFTRGISGDWPLILVSIKDDDEPERIERVIRAHTFLSGRQWRSDLVIIDEGAGGYGQPSRDYLRSQIDEIRGRLYRNLVGSVTLISGRELNAEQRQALEHAASIVLDLKRFPVLEQPNAQPAPQLPALVTSHRPDWGPMDLEKSEGLLFENGFGGFDPETHDYVIHLQSGSHTPAPWSNVLANRHFGTLVTANGSMCTWADNSSESRISPWLNDPVMEPSGEVLYLRDEETGEVWSPTPAPRPAPGEHCIRHGLGYTIFTHACKDLFQELSVRVHPDQPYKTCRIVLENRGQRVRRITVTFYLEWVMGNQRSDHAHHLRCRVFPDLSTITAHNPFSPRSADAYAFVAASTDLHGFTTCRREFLGAGGSIDDPVGLKRIGLSGSEAVGNDPCAAIQVHLDIAPGECRDVTFAVGQGRSIPEVKTLINRFHAEIKDDTAQHQDADLKQLFSSVRIDTPEPAMNLMLNSWLPYQALMGRLWGRTGYYQSSGAFGFRDQLQDSLAMLWFDADMVREHLLRSASRQFIQGDVLHWWHEAPLRGVRTRCSDDLLWLPFAVAHYVQVTGDRSVLDEPVAYLEGQPLSAEESERYAEFPQSDRTEPLYEHCKRAIDRAAAVGPHGLPTIGSGDWNDGFNRVSVTGRGESVWLAWFLIRVLNDFSSCCELSDEPGCAGQYRQLASDLERQVESVAWDGQWYQRAFFDDGTPLGSASADECRIDLIAQAWSVLGPPQPTPRSPQAMQSALKHLVDDTDRLILLLAPPFDTSAHDPGYIKGYPPGIRENGAQYTHAATWAIWAMARLGNGERAMNLFRLLNPILRADSSDSAQHYALEPYVLAGDIYSIGRNRGQGGWSWYTGAAAWLYRAGIEALLGLQREGDKLRIEPCLPTAWPGFRATLSHGSSTYHIEVQQLEEGSTLKAGLEVDGRAISGQTVELVDDARTCQVRLRIRKPR